jgi:hypothetical protein
MQQNLVFMHNFIRNLFINEKNKITPYMHSFIHHIPDFIRKFKNLNKFSTQSLEKL